MEIELVQIDLRYEKLRRRNAHKERQLCASLAEKGQLFPVVVVRCSEASRYILLDGYKRVRALKRLSEDLAQATLWDLGELEALLLERLMRTSEADSALEQGYLLEELNERFYLSHEELGRRFDKSQSWVSRRLALVRALPRKAHELVQRGTLPAHGAMKYLVPMARAKRADCEHLLSAVGAQSLSTRQLAELYGCWAHGNSETRKLVVNEPFVVLRARGQAEHDKPIEKSASRKLLDDFGILIGTSRRARQRVEQGALRSLLASEQRQARQAARQARWECEALFRMTTELFEVTSTQTPLESKQPTCVPSICNHTPQELCDA